LFTIPNPETEPYVKFFSVVEMYIGPLMGILFYIGYAFFSHWKAFRQIAAPKKPSRSLKETYAKQKVQVHALLFRRVAAALLVGGTGLLGVFLFASLVLRLGGFSSPTYLDGGVALSILLAPLMMKLLFWKQKTAAELTMAHLSVTIWTFVVKIGCTFSQTMDGKTMQWGLPVFQWAAAPYGSHIFPYNLIYLLIMAAVLVSSFLLWRRGKPILPLLPLSFCPILFLGFFVGWDVGPKYLGLSLFQYCHLVLIAIGVCHLVVLLRNRKREKAARAAES
jgi:hypothetical protein